MRFTSRQLKRVGVETELGNRLGRIYDFVIEVDTQEILQYEVGNFLDRKKYLISQEQVVKFTEDKMIVKDSVKKIVNQEKEEKVKISTEPVIMREEN